MSIINYPLSINSRQHFAYNAGAGNGSVLQRSDLRLYPNPATDVVHLPKFEGEVQIFEMSGKQVGKYAVAEGQIDVSFLAAGSYVLNFQNEN